MRPSLSAILLTLLPLSWLALRPAVPRFEMADWGEVHAYMGDAIMWLAGLHAGAARLHHAVMKDGTLAVMLPERLLR